MAVKNLTNSFPHEEKYRLADQIIRSSRSVGNNIAEGHGRYNYQDNIRFCVIARGSLSETLDHLIVGVDDNIITEQQLNELKHDIDHCMKLLNGYILHLRNKRTLTTT